MERIKDISWNVEAFNHLVLRHIKKELIQPSLPLTQEALRAEPTSSKEKATGLCSFFTVAPEQAKLLQLSLLQSSPTVRCTE